MKNRRVVVAGAGLAGLVAARELEKHGARVTLVEARDRVGGRVHTIRDGFAEGQHGEAGADLIEGEQTHVLDLARELGLEPIRILRLGFGFYGAGGRGRRRLERRATAFEAAAKKLEQTVEDYRSAGKRWESAVAARIARTPVAGWLDEIRAGASLRAGMRGLRGFFLADPEDLSLIPLVDQFASAGPPGDDQFFRIEGGNDRLPQALAERLNGKLIRNAVVRRVRQHERGVRVTVQKRGRSRELAADYFVSALPATTLREVRFTPKLPPQQVEAIRALRYGSATRMLLQFERPFWRMPLRPRAFGTDLPIGAVWEAAEEQGNGPAMLSLLAGGRASQELRAIVAEEGAEGVTRRLSWLGRPSPLLETWIASWEDDPWSRGGYAYFDPAFDPALRQWLSRPFGRIAFAGEHTSTEAQGYMNGAVESGLRAATEIRYMSGSLGGRAEA